MEKKVNNIDNFKKKDTFLTPDNYFEELPQKINSRISELEKTTFKNVIFSYSFKYAAAITLFVLSTVLFFSIYSNKATNTDISKSTEHETYDILYYADIHDIEEDDIIYFLINNDPNSFDIEKEDIMFYLNENYYYYNELYDLIE